MRCGTDSGVRDLPGMLIPTGSCDSFRYVAGRQGILQIGFGADAKTPIAFPWATLSVYRFRNQPCHSAGPNVAVPPLNRGKRGN